MSHIFESEGLRLEYQTFGSGDRAMFAFHGFGSTSEMYRLLEPALGKKYTVYSFNLPFHGESSMDEETAGQGIYPVQLKKYFKNFLWHIHASYFSLLGYSIGGKVALNLVELMPDEVQDVFLFAPDGIKISPWYRFVTNTFPGKWVYRRLMLYPQRYMGFIKGFEKLRLIHPRTANFARSALDTVEKRKMVYNTWQCFRHLDPDIRKVQQVMNEKNLNVHLFFGKYDKVIPPSIGKKFVNGLRKKSALHVMESGHQLVKENANAVLEEILAA
jgi:pimeloyl-ACP methyl ester carboxylesterase